MPGKKAEALLADARAEAAKAREADIASMKGRACRTRPSTIARTILAGTADQSLDAVFRTRILKKLDALAAEKPSAAGDGSAVASASSRAAPLAEPERSGVARGAGNARLRCGAKLEFAVDPGLVAGAELHLPRGDLRFAWADQLKEAEGLLNAARAAG